MPKPTCGSTSPYNASQYCGQPFDHETDCAPSGGVGRGWPKPPISAVEAKSLELTPEEKRMVELRKNWSQLCGPFAIHNRNFSKYAPDEPVFIVRGRDTSAPAVLRSWLVSNPQITPERRAEVERCILAMIVYPEKKVPD